jgi:hypothetical protein
MFHVMGSVWCGGRLGLTHSISTLCDMSISRFRSRYNKAKYEYGDTAGVSIISGCADMHHVTTYRNPDST